MKVKLHKLSLGLAASMVLFAAMPAHALNKYGCIYAVDPWDRIVKDPYGNCIRTPYWTPEKNVPECGAVAAVPPATWRRSGVRSSDWKRPAWKSGSISRAILPWAALA